MCIVKRFILDKPSLLFNGSATDLFLWIGFHTYSFLELSYKGTWLGNTALKSHFVGSPSTKLSVPLSGKSTWRTKTYLEGKGNCDQNKFPSILGDLHQTVKVAKLYNVYMVYGHIIYYPKILYHLILISSTVYI